MTATVLVTLITGVVAALSALGGTALSSLLAARTERRRLDHERTLEQARLEDARRTARDDEVRAAYSAAQEAVIRLAVSTRITVGMVGDSSARLDPDDLPAQLRGCRDDYYAAKVATERLWDASPSATRPRVTALHAAADSAFACSRAPHLHDTDADGVESRLFTELRAIGGHLFPDEPVSVALTPSRAAPTAGGLTASATRRR